MEILIGLAIITVVILVVLKLRSYRFERTRGRNLIRYHQDENGYWHVTNPDENS